MLLSGKRGLEIRSDGARSAVSLDFHPGGLGRHRWYHLASAHFVRRSSAHRQEV